MRSGSPHRRRLPTTPGLLPNAANRIPRTPLLPARRPQGEGAAPGGQGPARLQQPSSESSRARQVPGTASEAEGGKGRNAGRRHSRRQVLPRGPGRRRRAPSRGAPHRPGRRPRGPARRPRLRSPAGARASAAPGPRTAARVRDRHRTPPRTRHPSPRGCLRPGALRGEGETAGGERAPSSRARATRSERAGARGPRLRAGGPTPPPPARTARSAEATYLEFEEFQ